MKSKINHKLNLKRFELLRIPYQEIILPIKLKVLKFKGEWKCYFVMLFPTLGLGLYSKLRILTPINF